MERRLFSWTKCIEKVANCSSFLALSVSLLTCSDNAAAFSAMSVTSYWKSAVFWEVTTDLPVPASNVWRTIPASILPLILSGTYTNPCSDDLIGKYSIFLALFFTVFFQFICALAFRPFFQNSQISACTTLCFLASQNRNYVHNKKYHSPRSVSHAAPICLASNSWIALLALSLLKLKYLSHVDKTILLYLVSKIHMYPKNKVGIVLLLMAISS